jgi:hypothetical protein
MRLPQTADLVNAEWKLAELAELTQISRRLSPEMASGVTAEGQTGASRCAAIHQQHSERFRK